jgi:FkbM family methyltransferase
MTALTPEEFVAALYRCCLGREPDEEGLASWAALIRDQGDPTVALAGIMQSGEFRSKWASGARVAERCAAIAADARRLLGRNPRIVDVGAQLLGLGSNPYDPLAQYSQLEITGFDPLEQRLAERSTLEGGDQLTLFPYAIGDGRTHTLHVNNDDATSSLFPLNTAHNAPFNHLRDLRTVETRTLQTLSLDDVLPPGAVDFLKLDVQGAELMILRAGRRTLEATAVVHCEVEFAPIYTGQPLYPEIQTLLNQSGFELIDLLEPVRYHYVSADENPAADRLLWTDAIFFRVTDDAETLCAQSLMAAAIYGKPSLAAHLLLRSRQAAWTTPDADRREPGVR